jgi:asparagine synthetase B (glutamine-hydrolysing)
MAAIAGVFALYNERGLSEAAQQRYALLLQKLSANTQVLKQRSDSTEQVLKQRSDSTEQKPSHCQQQGDYKLSYVPTGMAYEAMVSGQPWNDRDLQLLFDGRLHPSCKDELCRDLQLPANCKTLALIVALWRRYGANGLLRLEGSYRLLLFDSAKQTLILQRDLLSDRALYFRTADDAVYIASSPLALWQGHVDESAIASAFAFDMQVAERSIYAGVDVLQAGQQLSFSNGTPREQRQVFTASAQRCSDAEHIEHVRAALQTSARDHLADSDSGSLALSLSGGVDSNLVYAFCNQQLRERGQAPMAAASWSLASIPDSHEQLFAAEHAKAWRAKLISLQAEHFAPLSGQRRASEDHFLASPYRELKQALALEAKAHGVSRMFNGNFGDVLFLPRDENIADALLTREFKGLGAELLTRFSARPLLWRDPALRRCVRRALGLKVADQFSPAELTRDALRLLQMSGASQLDEGLPSTSFATRKFLYQLNFSAFAGLGASGEDEFAQAIGVEQVSPLRHRAVLRAMLALPWRLHNPQGISKAAFRTLLPKEVPLSIAQRAKASSLQPFFDAAINGPAASRVRRLLQANDADWPRFYQRSAIESYLRDTHRSDAASAKIWMCIAYELWRVRMGLRAE